MGLFNWNIKGKQEPSPAEEQYQLAKRNFADGNFTEALRSLNHAFYADINYKPLYKLAAETLAGLGADFEQSLFENALQHFNDGKSFNDLGDYYYEMQHYSMAVPFYEKAVALQYTEEPIMHNLAVSLARQFEVQKAHDLLAALPTRDFWSVFFLYKCKILLNQRENVAQAIDEMMQFLNGMPEQEGLDIPKQKVNELNEMFDRLVTIEQPKQHIRDWQFIQYGSVILDYFESDDYVAGGRYVAAWGTNESIKQIVAQLHQLLHRLEKQYSLVAILPDRASSIIGQVIAKELNLPFEYLDESNLPFNAVIVGANTADFNDWEILATIDNGNTIFAYNHCWLEASVLTPDIIGLVSQSYYWPWDGGGFTVNPVTNEMENTVADERAVEAIAEDIFALQTSKKMEDEHIAFYLDRKHLIKGIGANAGNLRYNFMIESPVPGSYFA